MKRKSLLPCGETLDSLPAFPAPFLKLTDFGGVGGAPRVSPMLGSCSREGSPACRDSETTVLCSQYGNTIE